MWSLVAVTASCRGTFLVCRPGSDLYWNVRSASPMLNDGQPCFAVRAGSRQAHQPAMYVVATANQRGRDTHARHTDTHTTHMAAEATMQATPRYRLG